MAVFRELEAYSRATRVAPCYLFVGRGDRQGYVSLLGTTDACVGLLKSKEDAFVFGSSEDAMAFADKCIPDDVARVVVPVSNAGSADLGDVVGAINRVAEELAALRNVIRSDNDYGTVFDALRKLCNYTDTVGTNLEQFRQSFRDNS